MQVLLFCLRIERVTEVMEWRKILFLDKFCFIRRRHLPLQGGLGYIYAKLDGQMFGEEDLLMMRCRYGSFDDIDQFANIAWPPVRDKHFQKFRGKPLGGIPYRSHIRSA